MGSSPKPPPTAPEQRRATDVRPGGHAHAPFGDAPEAHWPTVVTVEGDRVEIMLHSPQEAMARARHQRALVDPRRRAL